MAAIPVQDWERAYKLGSTPWRREQDVMAWISNAGILHGTALDLGCGTGEVSIWLSENDFEVEALDFSEEALMIARREESKVNFVHWDLERLEEYPFIHEYYDLIIVRKTLAYIANQEKFMDIIRKKLRGVCIVQTFLEHDESVLDISNKEKIERIFKDTFNIFRTDVPITRPGIVLAEYYLK